MSLLPICSQQLLWRLHNAYELKAPWTVIQRNGRRKTFSTNKSRFMVLTSLSNKWSCAFTSVSLLSVNQFFVFPEINEMIYVVSHFFYCGKNANREAKDGKVTPTTGVSFYFFMVKRYLRVIFHTSWCFFSCDIFHKINLLTREKKSLNKNCTKFCFKAFYAILCKF